MAILPAFCGLNGQPHEMLAVFGLCHPFRSHALRFATLGTFAGDGGALLDQGNAAAVCLYLPLEVGGLFGRNPVPFSKREFEAVLPKK